MTTVSSFVLPAGRIGELQSVQSFDSSGQSTSGWDKCPVVVQWVAKEVGVADGVIFMRYV